jgi:hypothetical protein
MIGEPLTNLTQEEPEIDVEVLLAREKTKISISKNISKNLSKKIFELIVLDKKNKINWEDLMENFECVDGSRAQLVKKIKDHIYNKKAKHKKMMKKQKNREITKFLKFLFTQKLLAQNKDVMKLT